MLLIGTNSIDCWLALPEFEPSTIGSGLKLDDFILGNFDEECLGIHPPESDWSDWFPPPERLTDWELCVLTDWAEIEAQKHDLIPDPDTFPLTDFFETKENNTYGEQIFGK